MPAKIRLLSDQTINQIAAGEVIENPSSVVKELVENSIDAGATNIKVEIKAGGLQLIKVVDNGSGMSQDDALLSIERHATSKIVQVEDLFSISSMGFRGEALASIAAISKFTLTTNDGSTDATKIEVDGGKILSVNKAARAQGTTIEIRSLFFNVPARKKFQKSASACSIDIHKILTNLSLAYPHVAFELINQDKKAFSFQAFEGKEFLNLLSLRVKASLGSEFLNCTYKVDAQEGPYHIQGFIGAPLYTRHNRSGQFLFINNRHVVSPLVSYAVLDGYATRVGSNRHPVYVLHIKMDPSLIDINVHPQKKEVRFKEEAFLKEKVKNIVSLALQQAEGFSSSSFEYTSPFSFTSEAFSSRAISNESVQESPFDFSFTPSYEASSSTPKVASQNIKLGIPTLSMQEEIPFAFEPKVVGLFSEFLLIEARSLPEFFNRLADPSANGLALVDLAAARARLAYEEVLNSHQQPILKQALLFPLTFPASQIEMEITNNAASLLNEMGFEIRPIGKDILAIEALPSFLSEDDCLNLVKEFLSSETKASSIEPYRKKVALLASKFARKQKNFIAIEEALLILKKLLKTSSPYHCPLGKNTLIVLGTHELRDVINKSTEK